MHKVLILAATGMAGHVIAKTLAENKNLKIITTARTSSNQKHLCVNLNDQHALINLIDKLQPNTVINCAGILVQQSKDNPSEAVFINSYLPQLLNKLSYPHTKNFKLIHISTDCVFNGQKGQYKETDETDAKDYYGKTKALGEINNSNNLTIRTSIIGPELKNNGTGLLHWFLNQSDDIKGFTKAIWSGVTTLELANFINLVITQSLNKFDNINGLYHLTNNLSINKYDLLMLFKQIFHAVNINILADSNYICDKSLLNTRGNLGLDYTVPNYNTMLQNLYRFMLAHKDLYSHYKLFNKIPDENIISHQ